MNKNKTLFISDLDGTLLNRNAELSRYTKDALVRMIADGLHFTVATARTAASAFVILDGVPWNIPLVLQNGVLIYDCAQKRFAQVLPFSAAAVSSIISTLRRLNMTGIMYQLKNNEQLTYYETLDYEPLRDFVEERKARYNKVFLQADFSDVPPEGIIYFSLLDKEDKIRSVYEVVSQIPGVSPLMYKDVYKPELWFLELCSDKATKRNATLYLRETHGYERVVGFGDNLNDLPMFEACDIKVAVKNALPEVKAAADFICDANDNDGVVKWLSGTVSAKRNHVR